MSIAARNRVGRTDRSHTAIRIACSVAAAVGALMTLPVQAVPALNYWNYADIKGEVDVQYTSPYLGQISFTVKGPEAYQNWDPANPNSVTSVSYDIAPNQAPGIDPVYDIVTSSGSYGFGYSGQAQITGASVHASLSTRQLDNSMNPIAYTPNSVVNASSQAYTDQQMFIDSTATHPSGSYGAILVGLTMDGPTPVSDSYASAALYAQSSFVDTAGVSYSSTFTASVNAGESSWTGTTTVYKKLLFQYGTMFDLSYYLWLNANGNSTVDFFNTGRISSIEIPYGASLDTGASQAGLGSLNQLFGTVFNSATPDAANTNWDFGNNGGGFTPSVPVPEPGTGLLLLAGAAVVAWQLKRKGTVRWD